MADVTFKGVEKTFGNLKVIHGVDIDIADGELVVFVGPSGCGKSTLLRMLAGLEENTGGEILIGTDVVNGLPPKDRDIAMVFQNYALYPHMTVAENIGFPLRMQGLTAAERKKHVVRAAELLGLESYLERYPRELSGGQRQRVAMGRAIVREPRAFLFDEPLSNLDAALRVQMRKEVKLLHRRLEATMIFVTHDQVEAMTLADRIVVLRDGRVEQIGTPEDVYRRPASTFVAGFIGSPPINLIAGTVRPLPGKLGLVPDANPALTFDLPEEFDFSSGQHITLGVRPENLVLVSPAGKQELEGKVVFCESSGQESAVTLDLGGLQLVSSIWGEEAPLIGNMVGVEIRAGEVLLFDERGIRVDPGVAEQEHRDFTDAE
ncbi:ABC transporter ATP-binding protein [Cucumibacter marinus]|uniref:ABC transporter ATP-binding protein n=1 Tax=Cucumibacter marinus TaxID=1121252 RepID=UPI00040C731F|nr:sn-glycerol-3-phosphate ABC transporter ATP-binding protein UgpC [Cucumibacter marinus]